MVIVVLEGNSRLAAYRILKIEDPITWSKIDCKILSSDISEEFIFILLGNFHITGKKTGNHLKQQVIYIEEKHHIIYPYLN